MGNDEFEWENLCTFFEDGWAQITFTRRSDRPKVDLHWGIVVGGNGYSIFLRKSGK